MIKTTIRVRQALVAVLAFALVWFWVFVHWIAPKPFYDVMNYDSEMPYLMSSLSIFRGYSYVYVDHPGTPVEILGSALLTLTYPIAKAVSGSFAAYHMMHPELFLGLARGLLTLSSIAVIVLLARHAVVVKHWTDGLTSAAVAALFFAVHPLAFSSLVLWSHNSFSFPAGSLLLLALLLMLRPGRRLRWWQLSALGLGAGVLTSVQLYFATWVVGIMVAVAVLYLARNRGWRQAIIASLTIGMASLAGFVAATLPIMNQYPKFMRWVINLLLHQGRYGGGEAGITSPEQFLTNFMGLWDELRLLFVAVGVVAVMLGLAAVLHRRTLSRNLGTWAVACGLLAQLILTTILIIKHPAAIYMMSVAAILPLILATAFTLLRSANARTSAVLRFISLAIGIIILLGFVRNLLRSVDNHYGRVTFLQATESDMERHFSDLALANGRDRDSLTVLWTYGTYARCVALRHGNGYASSAMWPEISQVCDKDLYLNIWNDQVMLDGNWVTVDRLDWDVIVVTQDVLKGYPSLASHGEVLLSNSPSSKKSPVFIESVGK